MRSKVVVAMAVVDTEKRKNATIVGNQATLQEIAMLLKEEIDPDQEMIPKTEEKENSDQIFEVHFQH